MNSPPITVVSLKPVPNCATSMPLANGQLAYPVEGCVTVEQAERFIRYHGDRYKGALVAVETESGKIIYR